MFQTGFRSARTRPSDISLLDVLFINSRIARALNNLDPDCAGAGLVPAGAGPAVAVSGCCVDSCAVWKCDVLPLGVVALEGVALAVALTVMPPSVCVAAELLPEGVADALNCGRSRRAVAWGALLLFHGLVAADRDVPSVNPVWAGPTEFVSVAPNECPAALEA